MIVVDYKLIMGRVQKPADFETRIRRMIGNGWQPIGETKIVSIDEASVLMQQMHYFENNQKDYQGLDSDNQ